MDYTALFSSLTGSGATFTAIVGGITGSRYLDLESKRASLRQAQTETQARVNRLQASIDGAHKDDWPAYFSAATKEGPFVDELYIAVRDHRIYGKNNEQSRTVRLSRLTSVLVSNADTWLRPPDTLQDGMQRLWEIAEDAIVRAANESRIGPDTSLAHVADPPISTLIRACPIDVPDVWKQLAHTASAEKVYDEPYVSSRGPSEIRALLAPVRERHFGPLRKLLAEHEQARLEHSLTSSRSVVIPDRLYTDVALVAGLAVLTVLVPALFLVPGPAGTEVTREQAWLVSGLFFIAIAGFVVDFALQAKRIRSEEAKPAALDPQSGPSAVPRQH